MLEHKEQSNMLQTRKNTTKPIRQNCEIYDAADLKLALLDLNKHGFDLHVSSLDAKRLLVTCKKTRNCFAIECLGHKE